MTITISEITAPEAWDRALLALPAPHILQSWAWGETKLQTGWRARRLLWCDDGAPHAAAALLFRRLSGRLPVALGYVPKGPLLDWQDLKLGAEVLSTIEAEARRAGVFFVKIDSDVREDTEEGAAVKALLAQRGWRPSTEQIQFRNTMVSNLEPSEDQLLAGTKPKWRYNVKLAERKGVTVRTGGPGDLPAFYEMYVETGRRDGFLVRPFDYYRAIWERFLSEGLAQLLLAEAVTGPGSGGEAIIDRIAESAEPEAVDRVASASSTPQPVAGLILFRYGRTAWYFYGASTVRGRDLMPNHALQWHALKWARSAGCTRYDWWGAPDVLDEGDPMWGVYRFKQGFGGEFVPHIGAWDYPINRPLYWIYTRAMPRLLDLVRRRHRAE